MSAVIHHTPVRIFRRFLLPVFPVFSVIEHNIRRQPGIDIMLLIFQVDPMDKPLKAFSGTQQIIPVLILSRHNLRQFFHTRPFKPDQDHPCRKRHSRLFQPPSPFSCFPLSVSASYRQITQKPCQKRNSGQKHPRQRQRSAHVQIPADHRH